MSGDRLQRSYSYGITVDRDIPRPVGRNGTDGLEKRENFDVRIFEDGSENTSNLSYASAAVAVGHADT